MYVLQEGARHNPLPFIIVPATVVPDWDENAPELDVIIARSSGSTLVDLPREKLVGKRIELTRVTFAGNCLYLAREARE